MDTKYIKTDELYKAAEILKNGGLCAIPTETVYGLAANALDENAVKNIFTAKGRPQDNPLIVHISEFSELLPLVESVPEKAKLLAEKFWPGPLTMIMKKTALIPDAVSAGLDTVAIRMPGDETARKIIKLSGVPLAAPSANTSGLPSPTNAETVKADMDGKIDGIVMGDKCSVGVESTVITLVTDPPRLLRPGGVTLEMLTSVIGEVAVDKAVFASPDPNEKVASPGMKYKHYAPKAKIIMVNGAAEKYIDFVNSRADEGAFALCLSDDAPKIKVPFVTYGSRADAATQAQELFAALRLLDERGCKICYAVAPEKSGISMAVYNRLIRACAFEVIDL